jgi:hypothetical protein
MWVMRITMVMGPGWPGGVATPPCMQGGTLVAPRLRCAAPNSQFPLLGTFFPKISFETRDRES